MSQTTTDLAERIDCAVKCYMRKAGVGALVLGVVGADDSVPPVKGYGITDPPGGLTPTGSSLFLIGSVTKTFTGAALAWLAQPGGPIASITDPAQKYIPDEQNQGVTMPVWQGNVPVSLVDLADFAPGFPPDTSKQALNPGRGYRELFHAINWRGNGLLIAEPGTTYSYADAAFELLGSILAHVQSGGQGYDFGALLAAFLDAARLGMPDTVVMLDEEQKARLVPGFLKGRPVAYKPGDWLIASTGDDMLTWLKFQMGLLDSPLNSLLPVVRQPQIQTGSGAQTGLGLFFRTLQNPPGLVRYWKNGAAEGFSSFMTFTLGNGPGEGIGVVVLANEKDAKPARLANTIFEMLAGADDNACECEDDA